MAKNEKKAAKAPPLWQGEDPLGWKNRTPATNILFFLGSGKQRDPKKAKKQKGWGSTFIYLHLLRRLLAKMRKMSSSEIESL